MYEHSTQDVRKLKRGRDDRMIAGVCAGLAKMLGADPTLIRVLVAVASLFSVGTGALLYLVCWIIVPEE